MGKLPLGQIPLGQLGVAHALPPLGVGLGGLAMTQKVMKNHGGIVPLGLGLVLPGKVDLLRQPGGRRWQRSFFQGVQGC